MLTRRDLLRRTTQAASGALLLGAWSRSEAQTPAAAGASAHSVRNAPSAGTIVNDVHSRLNSTRVRRIVRPGSVEEIRAVILQAGSTGRAVSVAGGRHAMGGQQFGTDTVLLDLRGLKRVLDFDSRRGIVEVEAGIEWRGLIDHLIRVQAGRRESWGIRQKQTGADRLSLGGALAANVHGRGLRMKPFIDDIESFDLIDAHGNVKTCSRHENPELFSLASGGYGLLGVVTRVRLRLARRRKLERVVELVDVAELGDVFEQRTRAGFLYGDFQYAIDPVSDEFLREGVCSCYRPVDDDTAIPAEQKELSEAHWQRLLRLAHADKSRAYELYVQHYLSTSGQIYWSDTHQLSTYVDDYHRMLDGQLGTGHAGSEMITEIYVPRPALPDFLKDVRRDFREHEVDLIYGTIRLIERDDESFLAWARRPWACVVFNLHVAHTPQGLAKACRDFRRLIDRGIDQGGIYYLTYHRWATRKQVESCYPQFAEFLRLKRQYDPEERFQSDWYRHYREMFCA